MAITQVVDIEMLEKLPDGNYKKKNPQTKASQVIANNGQTVEQHLAESATDAHLGKNIKLQDTNNNFTNKNVEGAMTELFTNVSNGKQLVGTAITDVDNSVVIPTDPTFGDLASAIGGISTGKKWAEGVSVANGNVTVSGLDFTPKVILILPVGIFRRCATTYAFNTSNSNYFKFSNTTGNFYNLDSSNYVEYGGFSLSVAYSTDEYRWYAFE